jgi:hypothetical protein
LASTTWRALAIVRANSRWTP